MVEPLLRSVYEYFLSFFSTFIPDYVAPNIPVLLQVLVLLMVAYVAGRIVKVVSVKFLNVMGLKRVTQKSWAESILKVAGYRGNIVELIGDLIKWLVYVLFLAIIIQTLGLPGVADIFTSVATFIPRFIAAILIIAIGFIIADFFGKVFEEATRRFLDEDVLSALSGGLIKYSVSLISIIMALSLLGLDVNSLTIMFSLILAAMVVVLVLGIKDIFPNYTAGIHIRKFLKHGEMVRIGEYSGMVERFEPLSVIIKDGNKKYSVPNSYIIRTVVEKKGK